MYISQIKPGRRVRDAAPYECDTPPGRRVRDAAVPAVEIDGLSVRYPQRPPLLTGFSLTAQAGECVAVRGESGSGKSTLLHCLCGLIPRSIYAETAGIVRLFGKQVSKMSRGELAQTTGIVFQDPETQLFCDTVEDEIAFGLENICLAKGEMAVRIAESLALTGLAPYRLASPKHLSGGQRQLVVLAAVLALRPRILLLDEAFSQLDEEGAARLTAHVAGLRGTGVTVIIADHDEGNLSTADREVVLPMGEAGHR
ncbi:MAG: energy-coupling factor ABC transporter ATP-binding protein [Oscillospiraceae bacterium]|nr:energy-coupling factor ABC transporter ATP-binding protein [Oscillospiraceae bacterium]